MSRKTRMIKPEDVLLDRRGRVKVADFGLAKIVGGNEPLTSLPFVWGLSIAGIIIGGHKLRALMLENSRKQRSSQPNPPASPLALVDFWEALEGGDYSRGWEKTAACFQRDISKADWIRHMEQVRKPFGRSASAQVLSQVWLTPQTRFEARYSRTFDVGLSAVETVICAVQPDGEWKVERYRIHPADLRCDHPSNEWSGSDSRVRSVAVIAAVSVVLFYTALVAALVVVGVSLRLVAVLLMGLPLFIVVARRWLKRSPSPTRASWLQAIAWIAWLLSIPVISFGVFSLNALLTSTGPWNPAPDEAVIVPLTWLGSLLLPICGWVLWRAAMPGSSRGEEVHSKQSKPNAGSSRHFAFAALSAAVLLLLVASGSGDTIFSAW
jgi:uncharacterized membrane protein YphA (DoxX/SURF4 family)